MVEVRRNSPVGGSTLRTDLWKLYPLPKRPSRKPSRGSSCGNAKPSITAGPSKSAKNHRSSDKSRCEHAMTAARNVARKSMTDASLRQC